MQAVVKVILSHPTVPYCVTQWIQNSYQCPLEIVHSFFDGHVVKSYVTNRPLQSITQTLIVAAIRMLCIPLMQVIGLPNIECATKVRKNIHSGLSGYPDMVSDAKGT